VVLPDVPVMPTTASSRDGWLRRPDVRHDDLGHVDGQHVIDHQRHGAGVDSPTGEVVAVDPRPAHTAEQRPRDHVARVVHDRAELGVAVRPPGLRVGVSGDQLAQPHR
jgi:hypothetical protein